jgi:adenylate cyclase
MADNDTVFEDKRVSRYHAEIIIRDGDYIIKDLCSQNGTWLNGEKIVSACLSIGDKIVIGGNTLLFNTEKKDIFAQEDTTDLITSIKSAKDILKETLETGEKDFPLDLLKHRTVILSALYRLSRDILQESKIASILQVSADTVLSNSKAERVFILIKDQETGTLKPFLCRDIFGTPDEGDKLILSRTLVDKVINDGVSMLVADAKKDSRLKGSESILLYGIRSAVCAPLLGSESIRGTIYADIISGDKQFSQDELHLLTTIGNLTAIAIEQADLREKIRRETEVRQRLVRYHSPNVVDEIIRCKGAEEVKEKEITIVFTDMKDFTRLSEAMGPRESARFLSEYFDLITNIIFQYKGTVDKFIGDAVMALFGAPFSDKASTEMAVRAAIDMQREVKKLNRFEIRIGINTGPAVIGNIGSSKRIEYTAIGDTVNIASRLQSMAEPGKIYIGETAYEKVKDMFKIKTIGMQRVKGKTAEVCVYEVLYD